MDVAFSKILYPSAINGRKLASKPTKLLIIAFILYIV
jgi:hypothetical protein